MKFLGIFAAAVMAALTFVTTAPAEAAAVSTSAISAAGIAVNKLPTLVEKTHGFHCRRRFGYDPRVGFRRWHRHPRACRRYRYRNRCVRVRRSCRRAFGYGRPYRRCVRRRGCRL